MRFFYLCSLIFLVACSQKPLIVLDSGHNPKGSSLGVGAISLTGMPEVNYNDVFTQELYQLLIQKGYQVELTRPASDEKTLQERSNLANNHSHNKKAVFISIHHDSTQLANLRAIKAGDIDTYQTIRPIVGSSFHISRENGNYTGSLKLAKSIGNAFYVIKRTPNLDHANSNYEKSLSLVDKKLGIYHHDKLVVLKTTKIPAVLIEIGVIVDKSDEAFIKDPKERQKLVQAVALGIDNYYNH